MHTRIDEMPSSKPFRYWRPLKMDLYILEEILGTFIGTTVFALFILLMFQALRLAEFLIVHGAPPILLGKLALNMAISFLPSALPLAFLISILLAFSRFSTDSELVALKASGFSVPRLAVPVLFFSVFVVITSFALNLEWVPASITAFKNAQMKIGNSRAVAVVKEGTFSGFFDLLLFANKVDNQHNRLHQVFIYDEREPKNPLTYVAREAEIVPVKSATEFGASIMLRLYEGSMHHQDLETHTYEKMDFETYHLYLKLDEGTDAGFVKVQMLSQSELVKKIAENPISTPDGRGMRGEFWRRYSTALSPLLFVFLGIGFGTFRHRTAKAGAILTGFVILLLYWTLQTFGTSLLLKGVVSPFIGMQIPNFAMAVLGIIGYRRATW